MADLVQKLATLPLLVALPSALGILLLSYFTLTYTERQGSLKYLRLALGIPSCLLWYACIFPDVEWPTNALYAAYLWTPMVASQKMLDVCFIHFADQPRDVPRWMNLKWKNEEGKALDHPVRTSIPLPISLVDRLAYAIDSLCSVRGASFYNDRIFDWASPYIYQYQSNLTNWQFFAKNSSEVILKLLVWDLVETIITAKKWNLLRQYPLTSLPLPQQLIYGLLIGTAAIATTSIWYDMGVTIFVPLFRLNQRNWPPMFNNILKSSSLQELWAVRWHATFDRVWRRMSIPFVEPLRTYVRPKSLKFFRAIVIFGFSYAYHNIMINGMKRGDNIYHTTFNISAFKLFMSQPFGLFLEAQVVNPLTEQLPGLQKRWIRRLFLYGWLAWTFRWFGDFFLHYGLFEKKNFDPSPSLWAFQKLGLDARDGL